MRTGEVSKILSREWNGMSLVRTLLHIRRQVSHHHFHDQSDKQFYLDQAKILKDNFNQKYPDYVYKRRPNNSRKRRKPDPSPGLPADHASSSEPIDDYSTNADCSDVSPVDVADMDDPRAGGQETDVRYASLPADPSGGTYPATQPRASSYHPPDSPYRSLDTRIPFISRPGRNTPDTGMAPCIPSASRGSEHSASYYHPYPSAQHHHLQSYFPESTPSAEAWSSARDDQNRIQMQSWSQGSHDLGGDDRHRGYAQAVSSHGWTNTSGSEGIPSSGSSGASTANYGFQTLTAPFYPPQSSSREGFPSSSVQPVSIPSQPYGVVTPAAGNIPVPGRSYAPLQQSFSSSLSSATVSYQPQPRTSLALSSGQPMSAYPHVQSTNMPPPAGSEGEPSQTRYLPRDR